MLIKKYVLPIKSFVRISQQTERYAINRISRMSDVLGVVARKATTEQFERVCMVDVDVAVFNSEREQNASDAGKTFFFFSLLCISSIFGDRDNKMRQKSCI